MTAAEAYATLELDARVATPDDVRASYKRLVRSYHPDTVQHTDGKDEAGEKTRLVIEAFHVLRRAGFPRPAAPGAERASRLRPFAGPSWDAEPAPVAETWQENFVKEYARDVNRYGVARAFIRTLSAGTSWIAIALIVLMASIRNVAADLWLWRIGVGVCGIAVLVLGILKLATTVVYHRSAAASDA